MTMSVQVDRNRLGTNPIGFDRATSANPDAAPHAQLAGSDRNAPGRTDQARSNLPNRHPRSRASIDPDTVASRLNRLFDTIRPPGRGPLRNYEVLQALRARGIEMSAPYLSQLRAGRRSHPSLDMLRPLADFFGVSIAYFTEADTAYTKYLETELCWLETTHDPAVRMITTALLTLSPDVRENLLKTTQAPHDVADQPSIQVVPRPDITRLYSR